MRDQADQSDARGQVDLIDRALAELAGRDPVVALRRPDVNVERAIVDLDRPISAAREPGDVPADVLLQEASGLLHRHPLGRLDRRQRRFVDPDPTPQCVQLLAPGGQPLGFAGDLLRVNRVGVHASHGPGLRIACPLESLLPLANLRLQPLPRAGVGGDRPERLEGRGLLLHLERGLVPQPGAVRVALAV